MNVRKVNKVMKTIIFNPLQLTKSQSDGGVAFDYGFCKNKLKNVLTISTPYYTPSLGFIYLKS